jgi:hypothetical protein
VELIENELFGHQGAPLPTPNQRPGDWSPRQRAARSFWTSSTRYRRRVRAGACDFCRRRNIGVSERRACALPMSASLQPPTRIWLVAGLQASEGRVHDSSDRAARILLVARQHPRAGELYQVPHLPAADATGRSVRSPASGGHSRVYFAERELGS